MVSVLLATAPAFAETRRVAIVVGQNVGGPSDAPLHYAENDASKVAEVLAELGDVDAAHLFLLRGARRSTLRAAFDRAAAAIAAFRARPEDRTVLLFFYSGHSDGEVLELGGDRVRYGELRAWLKAAHADVRIVVIDGCKSGAMVGKKGGTRVPPFEIKLTDTLDATGEALLTSSAADEVALESKEIRGSFFTHHLVSGLRGAADASGDGRVTLSEAYEYAFSHTLTATMQTGMGQHPAYDYRISGQGDMVLTEVARPTASLELPEGFDRALVVLVKRDQVLAELTSDNVRRIAVRPGEYAVRVWKSGRTFAGRVQVAEGQRRAVAWSELSSVTPAAVAAKGTPGAGDDLEGLTPEAQAEYASKFLQIGDAVEVTVHSQGGVSAVNTFVVYQGKYRKQMDELDFFNTVGRTDLAQAYRHRRTTKLALFFGGVAVVAGGAVWTLTHMGCGDDLGDPRVNECINDRGKHLLVGAIGAGVGGTLMVVGSALSQHPLEAHEMRHLADEYNASLRRRLSSPAGSPSAWSAMVSSIVISPYASAQGGGLSLMGRF